MANCAYVSNLVSRVLLYCLLLRSVCATLAPFPLYRYDGVTEDMDRTMLGTWHKISWEDVYMQHVGWPQGRWSRVPDRDVDKAYEELNWWNGADDIGDYMTKEIMPCGSVDGDIVNLQPTGLFLRMKSAEDTLNNKADSSDVTELNNKVGTRPSGKSTTVWQEVGLVIRTTGFSTSTGAAAWNARYGGLRH